MLVTVWSPIVRPPRVNSAAGTPALATAGEQGSFPPPVLAGRGGGERGPVPTARVDDVEPLYTNAWRCGWTSSGAVRDGTAPSPFPGMWLKYAGFVTVGDIPENGCSNVGDGPNATV
jgi:hypothetical protein